VINILSIHPVHFSPDFCGSCGSLGGRRKLECNLLLSPFCQQSLALKNHYELPRDLEKGESNAEH
jgi:hypothetical protein